MRNSRGNTTNWEARIGAGGLVVAALALVLSLYQTYENNKDAKKKEIQDSTQIAVLVNTYKKGLEENRRIRDRDAVQIDVLLKTYQQVLKENSRLRKRDAIQTALSFDENRIRHAEIEMLKKGNSPSFTPGFSVGTTHNFDNEKYKPFTVNISLKNTGKVTAQQTNISFFVVTFDKFLDKVSYCSDLNTTTFVKEILPGRSENLSKERSVNLVHKSNYNNRDSTFQIISDKTDQRYIYVLLARVVSSDEFVTEKYQQFYSLAFVANNYNRNKSYNFNPYYNNFKYSKLKEFIEKYGFDYKLMTSQIGQEYTYVKSYYYFSY